MHVDHGGLRWMCEFSPKAEFTQVDTRQQSAAALRPKLSFHCITLHGSFNCGISIIWPANLELKAFSRIGLKISGDTITNQPSFLHITMQDGEKQTQKKRPGRGSFYEL